MTCLTAISEIQVGFIAKATEIYSLGHALSG